MGRLQSFLTGVIVGAIGLYTLTTYHVVRADDGIHLVRKVTSGLGNSYVDIREFDSAAWNEHKSVALALMNAGKSDLVAETAVSSLSSTAHHLFDKFGGK